jgi:phenylpropionate dioxygenase-like ring-hydroxylating dioxygenase large terminal subunit
MFEGFANVWTPVLPSSALPERKPVALRVAGAPLVLFRDESGSAAALLDRCPHRGVALSLGKVERGRITCPFHGWRFDGRGDNVGVPWNPDAKCERLGVLALPVRERAGQVWVFTGASPTEEPSVHEVFERGDVRICGFVLEMKTHWTRAMENMLDWPHLPFVHAGTIGKGMAGAENARMDVEVEPTAWGFRSRISIDGASHPGSLDYRFPNRMNLFIPIPNKTLVMEVSCVPVDETHTRLVLMTARSFAKLSVLDRFFNAQNAKIAGEDRAVVESSHPRAVPRAPEERSVRTDGPTLRFRRRYFEELEPTSFDPAPGANERIALRRGPVERGDRCA